MLALSRGTQAFCLRPSLVLTRSSGRCLATTSGRSVDVTSSPAAPAEQRNADPSAVFVVSGASRGLGLEFTRQV